MPALVPVTPGEPRVSPKPQPIGNIPLILIFTTCGLLVTFVLWRKADSLRTVVAHQLQNWTQGVTGEGRIRLSEDDGPSATEFLQDDDEDDDEIHQSLEEAGEHLAAVEAEGGVWRDHGDDHAVASGNRS